MQNLTFAGMTSLALISGMLAVVFLAVQDIAIAAETPTEAIRTTFERVAQVLKDEELKKPGRQQERLYQLDRAIGERISYQEVAKRSLGEKWKELSEKEQREFVALFAHLLRDVYSSQIFQYTDEQVEYVDERIEGPYAEVRTNLKGSKVDARVNFRLINHSGEWQAYDVAVNGISMVRNYRGQFSSILQTSSYETLLEKLRTKSLRDNQEKED